MERISRNELVAFRLKKATGALQILSGEIEDLKKRLSLVEIHNEELQELIDRISESTAAISASVGKSLEALTDNLDFVQNSDENSEIATAEEFSAGGADDTEFDF
jgi:predicted  nucleic acid-binding Zn-ribbon protein